MARILVVDDDATTAQMLVDYLSEAGYDTAVEADGLRALQHIELRKPDMIILDLMLPVVTGVEVARRVKRDPGSRDIPILAVTGADYLDDIIEVIMVDSVLSKPFDLDHVGQRVQSLLSTTDTNEPIEAEHATPGG
jgi:two-component system, OmpR family, phosphate regulon response regulator PhoB